jgi:paraquat-inducible protein B
LRAELQSTSLITGQQMVALDFVPDAPPVTMTMKGEDFVLPTAPGGGFAGLQASATELLNKVGAIPFDQIGRRLDGILKSVDELAQGAQMKKALGDLAGMIAATQTLVQRLDTGVGPALKQLPEIATGLQKTLTSANKLVLSLDNGYGDNTKFNRDLGRLMAQLNDAVRSIRSLADLLERHPEALVKGRPQGGTE